MAHFWRMRPPEVDDLLLPDALLMAKYWLMQIKGE
jgi:hypothetical protein